MKKIFEYIRQETAAGHDLVLASIISQEGSSPRGLGAQMLVGADKPSDSYPKVPHGSHRTIPDAAVQPLSFLLHIR